MKLFEGDHETLSGIVKVKCKGSQKGKYIYNLIKSNGKYSHLTIRNLNHKKLQPLLYYNEKTKSFDYWHGTDKEGSAIITSDKSDKEIILSGFVIWLKLEKKRLY